jgi:predicted dehydrogenase
VNKKIKVGVVGVGHVGSLHAKMFREMQGVDFSGVFDINEGRNREIASEFGVKAYSAYADLLNDVHAITIATPTSTHFDVAVTALEMGVHTFIEKPMTETVEEAETLVTLSKRNKVKIQVGHIERFNPALIAIEDYDLKPMFIESHRLAQFNPRGTDVPVVLDLMIHDIDIILSLVKSPVENIEANGVAVVSDGADIANARIQFKNGCVANVTASRISQRKMRKMRLFQRDAYISLDFSEGTAEVFRLVDDDAGTTGTMRLGQIDAGAQKRNIVYEQPQIKDVNALKYELELFVNAIRSDIEPVVTAEDGKQALEVAHAIMTRIQNQQL